MILVWCTRTQILTILRNQMFKKRSTSLPSGCPVAQRPRNGEPRLELRKETGPRYVFALSPSFLCAAVGTYHSAARVLRVVDLGWSYACFSVCGWRGRGRFRIQSQNTFWVGVWFRFRCLGLRVSSLSLKAQGSCFRASKRAALLQM